MAAEGDTWQKRGQRIEFDGATSMSMSGYGSALAMYAYDKAAEEWKEYGAAKTGVPGNGFVGITLDILQWEDHPLFARM